MRTWKQSFAPTGAELFLDIVERKYDANTSDGRVCLAVRAVVFVSALSWVSLPGADGACRCARREEISNQAIQV